MTDHFMLSDLAGTIEAVLAFSLIALAPGYVVGWVLRLMDFRQRGLVTRLALAVPISIGICPILTYLLWRFVPPMVWIFYGVCAAGFVVLVVRERRELFRGPVFKGRRVFWAIVSGWVLLATLSLIDLQIGYRLYFPTVAFDYSLRATVTASVTHFGVPVHNPFFFPGRPSVMRYHHFWFILCAVAQRITAATVTARIALIGGTIWCGIGLIAIVALYIRFFQPRRARDVVARTLAALALLAVTGLDILPAIFIEWRSHEFLADMEWWNEQISAWITTALWTPNHLAGLIACLMGLLLIRNAVGPGERPGRAAVAAAGLMFASAVGLTVDVTLDFAIFLVTWTAVEFLRGHRSQAGLLCLAGCIAGALSVPFLMELFSGKSGGAPAVPLLLTVRSFPYVDQLFALNPNSWQANLSNLALLPLNYGLEFGFFLIAGAIQTRRMWRKRREVSEADLCAFVMVLSSFVVCTFVSSAVESGNDFGVRGFLPAQFILLLWGGEMLAGAQAISRRGVRLLILATMLVGVSSSLYELFKIRFYPLVADLADTPRYAWLALDHELGHRTFALRQMYDTLRRVTPDDAVFQHNPYILPEDIFHGVYADRQVAVESLSCRLFSGSDASLCTSNLLPIGDLFGPGNTDPAQIDEMCGRYTINYLVVRDADRVWGEPESWVWKRKPMMSNPFARVFACGPEGAGDSVH